MKVCTNASCKHGYAPQPNSNFAKRGKKKKNGEEMYLSHCKACTSRSQSERVSKKRASDKARVQADTRFKCVDCGVKVSRYSPRCRDCATLHTQKEPSEDRYKGTVPPKLLEPRGYKQRKALGLPPLDFSGSTGCAVSVEA